MKKKRIFIAIVFVLCAQMIAASPSAAQTESNTMVEASSVLTFQQTWETQNEDVEKPTPPNVWDVLDNVSAYNKPEHDVYTGDEVIPSELLDGMEWSKLQINITAIQTYYDVDFGSAEEVFIRYAPNYYVGPPMDTPSWNNYMGYYTDLDIYNEYTIEANTWTNFTEPITLFEDWTVLSTMMMEVQEDDTTVNDDLGQIMWLYEDPQDITGYWELETWDEDDQRVEACVAFEISVLETDSVFTAANLTELFQPFLMEADDTDYTSDPNGLFGRVIHGYDPAIGMNSLCIQYLYYWSEVWEGDSGGWSDGELIHYDDFELVQVYLNLTYTGGPVAYRFVFDNRDYYTNSDTEWRDSMEYSIYEWDVSNTAIITEEVENSEDLKPLLGETYTAHYQYKNLTQYTGDFCSCYGGVASLILTVETYNHQFAMGDTADHSSGSGYLGQYYIDPYTDDVIYDCYSQLNYSFTEGVHLINGYTVPDYAPFAYDVLQVFTAPYIHSNFDLLMQQAAAFHGDIQTDGNFVDVEKNITVTLEVPVDVALTTGEQLTPGEIAPGDLEITFRTEDCALTVDYMFNITAQIQMFFLEKHFESIVENSLVVNFSNPVIQTMIDELNLGETQENSVELLDEMISIDSAFTPQMIGEILNCNITFHLIEILSHYFPSASILEWFFEDIYFTINPVLSGYMDSVLHFGGVNQDIRSTQSSQTFDVDLTIPSGNEGEQIDFILDSFMYGMNLEVNWLAGLDFKSYLESYLTSQEYHIGTWPSIDMDLAPLEGAVESTVPFSSYEMNSEGIWIMTSGTSSESQGPEDNQDQPSDEPEISSIDSSNSLLLIGFSALCVTILMKRKRQ